MIWSRVDRSAEWQIEYVLLLFDSIFLVLLMSVLMWFDSYVNYYVMRPLFTVHAGEFIVGEFIEQNFRNLNVWIPSKDTGIDFLITDQSNTRTLSLQVKLSRDYKNPEALDDFQHGLDAAGWLTLSHEKIKESQANYWVFVLVSHERRIKPQFIIITPDELLNRLSTIHPGKKSYHFYPWIITTKQKSKIAIQGRGLSNKQKQLLVEKGIQKVEEDRDLTSFLNNWAELENLNKMN